MSNSTSIFPPSPDQAEASRRNGAKSRGPKTEEGKARSSQNALTHGVFAKTMVVDGEEQEEFDAVRIGLLRSLNPRDTLELQLAEQIISANWRLHRLRQAENKLYAKVQFRQAEPEQEEREKLVTELERKVEEAQKSVNRSSANRDWYVRQHKQLVKELRAAKAELNEPIDPLYAGVVLGKLMGAANASGSSSSGVAPLERLHRYERGLENTIHRCLNQLRKLQEKPLEGLLSELAGTLIEETEKELDKEAESPGCDTDFQSVPQTTSDQALSTSQEHHARTESPCHDDHSAKTNPDPSQVVEAAEDEEAPDFVAESRDGPMSACE